MIIILKNRARPQQIIILLIFVFILVLISGYYLVKKGGTKSNLKVWTGMKLLPPENGIYHGAFAEFGPTEDVVTEKKIKQFESLVGREILWGYFSNNWIEGIRYPAEEIEALQASGVIPFIRLMPRSRFQDSGQDPVYTLQRIIDGEFDEELRMWARSAAEASTPLLLEFGTEVNGDWFAWSGSYNGGKSTRRFGDSSLADGPERFRVAYRHIIDLFREEGALNVTWFFHVNLVSSPNEEWNKPAAYYPGDDYIDWLGVSVYGAQDKYESHTLFSEQMDRFYGEIHAIAPSKPIAVLEFGTIERLGYDKALWIEDALESARSGKYGNLYAVSYWHSKWRNEDGSTSDMRIDSSRRSLRKYRELIQDPYFITTPLFSD